MAVLNARQKKTRDKLVLLLKSAPSARGLSDAEIDGWVDSNVEFTQDGTAMRVAPPAAQTGPVQMLSRGEWPFGGRLNG